MAKNNSSLSYQGEKPVSWLIFSWDKNICLHNLPKVECDTCKAYENKLLEKEILGNQQLINNEEDINTTSDYKKLIDELYNNPDFYRNK